MKLAIVADDFTGACEMAALFARRRAPVSVYLQERQQQPGQAVTVINTDSRNMPGEVAATRVRALWQSWSALSTYTPLFKKIDSTLRGPIGQELEALRKATGVPHVLVAPALPSQGRTTIVGYQLVRGVPLEYTPAARDPHSSAATSHIPTLLYQQIGVTASHIGLRIVDKGPNALLEQLCEAFSRSNYCVVDAATDHHLEVIAAASRSVLTEALIVGTAGLARYLADALLPGQRQIFTPPAPRAISLAGILVVGGSMNPVSVQQLQYLGGNVNPPPASLAATPETIIEATTLAHYLDSVGLILTAPQEPLLGWDCADTIAHWVEQLLKQTKPQGIFATGGETAQRILQKLAVDCVTVYGEAVPGLPFGVVRGGRADGIRMITKAGGFGEIDTILEAIQRLQFEPYEGGTERDQQGCYSRSGSSQERLDAKEGGST